MITKLYLLKFKLNYVADALSRMGESNSDSEEGKPDLPLVPCSASLTPSSIARVEMAPQQATDPFYSRVIQVLNNISMLNSPWVSLFFIY